MSGAPRVLLLTPDHPPAQGAIQHVLRGIVRHANRVQLRVLTLGDARGVVTALAETRSWQPDVVLSGHIVTAPAARLSRAPFVQYLYASELADRPHLTSFAMRHASASIVVGELGRSLALAAGADHRRIHIIPPGIDLPAPPTTTPREREPLIVSVAGPESRHKGLEVLVRALPLIRSRVPAATMTLAGGARLRSSFVALAAANGCGEALRCVGDVGAAERDALLRAATVFALPSRGPGRSGGDGLGIGFLEASAHGTAVVAGNVGGAVDAVVDGQTGMLVAPDSHVDVAEAISTLLLDRDLAARLGDGGRSWAELFAWPTVVRQVEDVLIEAAARA